jgi:hypothetical protein
MKKRDFKNYPVGSAEYVIGHALWRNSRGKRNPSVPFNGIKNPRIALDLAIYMVQFAENHPVIIDYVEEDDDRVEGEDDQIHSLIDFGLLISVGFGNLFSNEDSNDLTKGADTIPFKVTDARRLGQKVAFVQNGKKSDWHWEMPDGTKVYHDKRDEIPSRFPGRVKQFLEGTGDW